MDQQSAGSAILALSIFITHDVIIYCSHHGISVYTIFNTSLILLHTGYIDRHCHNFMLKSSFLFAPCPAHLLVNSPQPNHPHLERAVGDMEAQRSFDS